jgi:hypothetical protein
VSQFLDVCRRVPSSARWQACVGVALAAIGACQRDQLPTQSLSKRPSLSTSQLLARGSRHNRPAENRFVQLANEIPGFAGYYIEAGSGQLVAYVKDSVQKLAGAAASLNAHLGQDGLGIPARQTPRGVRIKQADYDFQTLSDYRDYVTDSVLGTVAGIVTVDLDEQINRVTIGIETSKAPAAQSLLLDRLRQHGIPVAAVNIRWFGGIVPLAAHRSSAKRARRRYGTVLEASAPDTIAAGLAYHDAASGIDCTVGPVIDSGSTRMFVSASHCTVGMFHLDNDTVKTEGGTAIGRERGDRASTGSGCAGICWVSRASDAATFDFSSGLKASIKGAIARPNSRDTVGIGGARDTLINSSHPWLFVTSTLNASDLVTGEEIDKIGMRSGWTHGTISTTCADQLWNVGGSYYKVICEAEADGLMSRAGDSGGPVFVWDGYDGAVLIGTVSGGHCTCGSYWGGTEATGTYFSYWSADQSDLGTFDPLNNTTVSTPSLTGSVSSGNAVASWSAVSTTNTTAPTHYQIFQWTWEASTSTWTQNEFYVGSITSLSYTDASAPWTITSATGGSQPDQCTYSSVGIEIRAYNQGAYAYSGTIWFQGPANGPGGGAC